MNNQIIPQPANVAPTLAKYAVAGHLPAAESNKKGLSPTSERSNKKDLSLKAVKIAKTEVEDQGIEPWTSCMLSTRSTNWANPPCTTQIKKLTNNYTHNYDDNKEAQPTPPRACMADQTASYYYKHACTHTKMKN